MRALTITALALSAVGCASSDELRFTSTLDAEVNGLRLTANGLDAVAAMAGTTCTIDTNWGCPVADADLPTEAERIVDLFEGTTVATTDDGVHIIRDSEWIKSEDMSLPNVQMAGADTGGLVTVAGTETDCAFRQGQASVAVDGALCADGMTYSFDREGGRVFAAGNGQVFVVSAEGSTQISDAHDLASFDAASDALFVSSAGGFEVSRMAVDGSVAWTHTVEGPVVSLAARGTLGQALVLTEGNDGYGRLERLDGADGDRLAFSRIPTFDRQLEVSENGAKVAMITPSEVHFYEMDAGIEALPVDETPVTCIVPTQTRRVTD
ncbi:MAG: hypothetical protein AAGA48_07950 [Myxococcota bacterium]